MALAAATAHLPLALIPFVPDGTNNLQKNLVHSLLLTFFLLTLASYGKTTPRLALPCHA
jgi:hypothetical protein